MHEMELEWSLDAIDDLDNIWDIIADESVDIADSFIEQNLRNEVLFFRFLRETDWRIE